ncbi:hypothetical protein [[Mycoplasma] testudinis]|uniref:hypothetical protein n=1 Tax=[Mycoplasma] testudinis TaxID=33924 RepID=UPI0004849644|nr:hypothetical protein [[Mycoplasma] testudinis]
MSRFEKHRAIREQMNNEFQIKKALQHVSDLVASYHDKINNIHPKILLSLKPIDIKLMDLLTIDTSNKDSFNQIQQFINEFNFSELTEMQDQAELLLSQSKSNERGNLEFEQGWLDQDAGAVVINQCNLMFNAAQKQNINFDKTSYQDLIKFKKIVHLSKNNRNHITQLYPPKEVEIKRGHSTYKLFLTCLFALIVIGLAAIVITIVSLVL